MKGRLIVIGAGPIGLEAALLGKARGFQVTVLERGKIGQSLLRWGATKFFSPFSMNTSTRLREALGERAPKGDVLLTGPEMVERVLVPLCEGPLQGLVKEHTTVRAVGRVKMGRRDMAGNPIRAERPFRVLIEDEAGERYLEAEHVLDASGVTIATRFGAGGLPALGELRELGPGETIRTLGDLHDRLLTLAGKHLLLVGNGHSAANAICALQGLAQEHPGTRITWAVRTMNKRPCVEVASDPLPERQKIVSQANQLAHEPPPHLQVERRAQVESISKDGDQLVVGLSGDRKITCDHLAAFTGWRPDHSFLSEVSVQLSAVSEGALGIERTLSNVTDCLSVPAVAKEDLASGEPGFHLIGSKSYGRMTTFLLKNGIEQLETVIDMLQARED